MHVLFKDHGNDMKYESLIIEIFSRKNQEGYSKGMDPLGFGSADAFGNLCFPDDSENFIRGKVEFAAALGGLAYRCPEGKHIEPLQVLIREIASAKTQDSMIEILDKAVQLVESIKE